MLGYVQAFGYGPGGNPNEHEGCPHLAGGPGARLGGPRGSQPAAPQAAKGSLLLGRGTYSQDSRRLVRNAGARAPLSREREGSGRPQGTNPARCPWDLACGKGVPVLSHVSGDRPGACFHGLRALLDPLSPRVPPSHPGVQTTKEQQREGIKTSSYRDHPSPPPEHLLRPAGPVMADRMRTCHKQPAATHPPVQRAPRECPLTCQAADLGQKDESHTTLSSRGRHRRGVTASCCQRRAERDSGSGNSEGMAPGLAAEEEAEAGPPCGGPRGGWEGTGAPEGNPTSSLARRHPRPSARSSGVPQNILEGSLQVALKETC